MVGPTAKSTKHRSSHRFVAGDEIEVTANSEDIDIDFPMVVPEGKQYLVTIQIIVEDDPDFVPPPEP